MEKKQRWEYRAELREKKQLFLPADNRCPSCGKHIEKLTQWNYRKVGYRYAVRCFSCAQKHIDFKPPRDDIPMEKYMKPKQIAEEKYRLREKAALSLEPPYLGDDCECCSLPKINDKDPCLVCECMHPKVGYGVCPKCNEKKENWVRDMCFDCACRLAKSGIFPPGVCPCCESARRLKANGICRKCDSLGHADVTMDWDSYRRRINWVCPSCGCYEEDPKKWEGLVCCECK